jgi:hypothetical protein
MKCIKKDGEIRRVSDVDADLKVKVHGWTFAPKVEWKNKARDANKKIIEVDINAEVVIDKKLAKRLKLKEKQSR